jgi:ABC-type dipeptide/oligopeptide/nickel transport system ATPase component
VEFLPQCDRVAIMDEGQCVYFGPWNESAAQTLSKYLPASHLLAAAGAAEQPAETKPVKKGKASAATAVSPRAHRGRAPYPGAAKGGAPARARCLA